MSDEEFVDAPLAEIWRFRDDPDHYVHPDNRTYRTYTLQDYERVPKLILAQIDYLIEMFDLEVQNEKGKPIVITLRDKQSRLKP